MSSYDEIIIGELREQRDELLESLSALVMLVRNSTDIYDANQLRWVTRQRSFQRAETVIQEITEDIRTQ